MERVYGQMIKGGSSGLDILLCGIRTGNGKYIFMGVRTDLWSSSKSEDGQWFYIIDGKENGKPHGLLDSREGTASLASHQDNATWGKSVRLFKD